jgi:hypothetical protein
MPPAAAAASPRHLQFIASINSTRRVITFPSDARGASIGSVWTGSLQGSRWATVTINASAPAEEEQDASEADDDFYAQPSTDDDDDWQP